MALQILNPFDFLGSALIQSCFMILSLVIHTATMQDVSATFWAAKLKKKRD
jgi:hypothetical protein